MELPSQRLLATPLVGDHTFIHEKAPAIEQGLFLEGLISSGFPPTFASIAVRFHDAIFDKDDLNNTYIVVDMPPISEIPQMRFDV